MLFRALVALSVLVCLVPASEAAVDPPGLPAYNCSPGFGGGVYCWVWAGNGCESEVYVPPTPLYPGPGDTQPHAFVYGCAGTSCYNDVELGGIRCEATPIEGCTLVVRTGAPSIDPAACA